MEESTEAQDVESGEEMGIVSRMIGALISPGRTFAAVNARVDHRDWYLPMIIIVVVGMISAYQLMPAAQTAGMEAMQERLAQDESLTEEQRALALESAQRVMGLGAVVLPSIGTAVTIFVQGLIFFALANFVFGGDGTYKKILAVVSYSSLVVIPAAIVTLLLAAAWDSPSVQPGLGLLVPESMKGSFADHVPFHDHRLRRLEIPVGCRGPGGCCRDTDKARGDGRLRTLDPLRPRRRLCTVRCFRLTAVYGYHKEHPMVYTIHIIKPAPGAAP